METEDKHKLVVDEWFRNGYNGAKAWQSQYPESKIRSAAAEFVRMLTNVNISDYKKAKENELLEASRFTHLESLNYAKNAIYADVTDVIGLQADEIKELPLQLKQLISEVDIKQRVMLKEEGVEVVQEHIKIKFFNKKDALEMLNKNIGFYKEDNSQKGKLISTPVREWVDPPKHDEA